MLAQRPSGATLRWASELLGWSRLWQGDRAGAEGAVQRYAHAGPPSGSFRAAQALAAGRIDRGRRRHDVGLRQRAARAVAGARRHRHRRHRPVRGVHPASCCASTAAPGVQAAVLFHGLLDYAGYDREAAEVAALLAADGRASQPRP